MLAFKIKKECGVGTEVNQKNLKWHVMPKRLPTLGVALTQLYNKNSFSLCSVLLSSLYRTGVDLQVSSCFPVYIYFECFYFPA